MARLPRRLRAPSFTENPQESGRNWRNNNERVQDPATKMSDAFWNAHNALCGAIRAPLPFSTPSKGARLLLPRVDKKRRKGGGWRSVRGGTMNRRLSSLFLAPLEGEKDSTVVRRRPLSPFPESSRVIAVADGIAATQMRFAIRTRRQI